MVCYPSYSLLHIWSTINICTKKKIFSSARSDLVQGILMASLRCLASAFSRGASWQICKDTEKFYSLLY